MRASVEVHVADGIDLRRAAPGVGGHRSLCAIVRRAARATLRQTDTPGARISIALLDDGAIAGLHRQWLDTPGPTDVLAFALHQDGEPAFGDVYIGLEQARRQAAALAVPLEEELARLAIHGTLHVLGWDHPDGRARERSRMWKLQERILWGLNAE
ncbi:MAG: rRNA maturation RNase YbeY [Gemmatimonadetes bacterium]|nr:rRNA maturation RNase YbeY [Gemmatimonadota bacterium]